MPCYNALPLYRAFLFYMPYPFVPLKKHPSYFITAAGIVLRTLERKEVECSRRQSLKSKRVLVKVQGKELDLLSLMLEHFNVEFKASDKIKFAITEDLRIPLESIRIKRFAGKYDMEEDDERLLFKYKCDVKANSANNRCSHKITPVQVYLTLKIHKYKCIYCAENLKPDDWHLDHFASLHKGGHNVFENIVPSCPMCNIMKGALEGKQFYKRCKIISDSYLFSEDQLKTT